jgi:hypothetical protein
MVGTALGPVKFQRPGCGRGRESAGLPREVGRLLSYQSHFPLRRSNVAPALFVPVLACIGVLGLLAGMIGAFRRSPLLMVTAGFLVVSSVTFAVTTLALA